MDVRFDHPVGPLLGMDLCEQTTPIGGIQSSPMPGWSALPIKVSAYARQAAYEERVRAGRYLPFAIVAWRRSPQSTESV